MNFYQSMLWFWLCYLAVTVVGFLHTCYNHYVLKIQPTPNTKPSQLPAYIKTIPYHIIYNIILFPLFALLYFKYSGIPPTLQEALILGTTWCVITILIDLIGWVLIPHPWSMSFKEMYIDYQPYITLIYIAIWISPLMVLIIL